MYALGAVYANRHLAGTTSPLVIATGQVISAFIIVLPVAAVVDGLPQTANVTPAVWGAVATLHSSRSTDGDELDAVDAHDLVTGTGSPSPAVSVSTSATGCDLIVHTLVFNHESGRSISAWTTRYDADWMGIFTRDDVASGQPGSTQIASSGGSEHWWISMVALLPEGEETPVEVDLAGELPALTGEFGVVVDTDIDVTLDGQLPPLTGSFTVEVDTSVGQVTGLIAAPVSSSRIDLEWDAFDGAVGYDVERDDAVVAFDVDGETYSDTDLDPDTQYTYRVRAVID
jgi:hypothetical protein